MLDELTDEEVDTLLINIEKFGMDEETWNDATENLSYELMLAQVCFLTNQRDIMREALEVLTSEEDETVFNIAQAALEATAVRKWR